MLVLQCELNLPEASVDEGEKQPEDNGELCNSRAALGA